MFKILTNKYDNSIIPKLELNEFSKTRGNNLKLNILESNHDLRKYSFCVRVPKIWNTINSFKINVDNFWANKEVKYNYRAALSERDRNVFSLNLLISLSKFFFNN